MVSFLIKFSGQALGLISAIVIGSIATSYIDPGVGLEPIVNTSLIVGLSMITMPLATKFGTVVNWAWKLFLILIIIFVIIALIPIFV